MRNFIVAVLCGLLPIQHTMGQQAGPAKGSPCPPFTLTNVVNYPLPQVSNTDFIGKKWLVLDFWARTCRACIEAFPKLDALQREFGGEVQFLLVGNIGGKYNRGVEELYEKQRVKHQLDLTVAFDSLLRDEFKFQVIPHIVIVDKAGKVYATTGANELTREKLKALVEGRRPEFELKIE